MTVPLIIEELKVFQIYNFWTKETTTNYSPYEFNFKLFFPIWIVLSNIYNKSAPLWSKSDQEMVSDNILRSGAQKLTRLHL
jgi:hypothetical protein